MNPEDTNSPKPADPYTSPQPTASEQTNTPQPLPQPQSLQGTEVQDPGATLGIVALVFAFLLPVVGLVLGLMAKSKSKAVGIKNNIALVAIIISSLSIILVLLIIILSVILGVMASNVDTVNDDNYQSNMTENIVSEETAALTDWPDLVSNYDHKGDDMLVAFSPESSIPADYESASQGFDEVLDFATLYPDEDFLVIGLTDSINDDPALAKVRAQVVLSELIARGIPTDHLLEGEVTSYNNYFGADPTDGVSQVVAVTLVNLAQ